MKYIRWLLLLLLLISAGGTLMQHPFFKELPMLLLPEQNSDIIMCRADYNIYDDVLDPRPICIQTKNNFSCFSGHNDLEENHIIAYLKSNLSFNDSTLLDDKMIVTSRKDFLPEVTPVWVTKRIAPMHITEKPKQIFIPKE